jgi:hypothetical protein
MAVSKITLSPGIATDPTPTLNATGWSAANLIRWQDETFLQPIGGWQKFNPSAVTGTARQMHAWQDLDANDYLAVGTEQRLQLFAAGTLNDITPIRATTNFGSGITTTASSTSVQVTDTGNGAAVGDWINMVVPIAIGGIVLSGYYQVATIIDSDNYTITAASAAASSVSLGGASPKFDTTNTSSTVTVTLANHGYGVGATFTVLVSTSVGGLTISGDYIVNTVPSSSTFTITAAGMATSTTNAYENSDQARVQYLLATGNVSTTTTTGWGAGSWGSGSWGVSSGAAATDPLRIWSLDNFGQNLQAVPTGGALYQWVPPVSNGNVAAVIGTAPTMNNGMFVSMPAEIVVCWGSESSGTHDPLLIRWSDAGDNTDWTASATNQAGSYRLSRGSKIVGAFQGPQSAYIWTDTDLWVMNYVQTPYIFSFSIIGQTCGLIAQNAFTVLNQNIYWMSQKNFFMLGPSGVQPLVTPVWDDVFGPNGVASDYSDKSFAAGDTPFNEVFFYFAAGDDTEPGNYVKLNALGNLWDEGELVRTAWIDQGIFGMPIGVDGSGYLQQHETGVSDNGSPITGIYARSGYADVSDGTIYISIQQIIPDFKWLTADASLTLTFYGQNFPGDTPTTYGPYTVTASTSYITVRIRKRQIAIRVDFDGESLVRLGAIRYLSTPAGRR